VLLQNESDKTVAQGALTVKEDWLIRGLERRNPWRIESEQVQDQHAHREVREIDQKLQADMQAYHGYPDQRSKPPEQRQRREAQFQTERRPCCYLQEPGCQAEQECAEGGGTRQ